MERGSGNFTSALVMLLLLLLLLLQVCHRGTQDGGGDVSLGK
jgi:hypothetical protein